MKADGRGGLDDLGRQPAGQSSLGPTLRDLTAPGQEWAATRQLLPLQRRIDTAFAATVLPGALVAYGNTVSADASPVCTSSHAAEMRRASSPTQVLVGYWPRVL